MKSTTLKTAVFVEEKIDKICQDYADPYNLEFASIWTMTTKGDMVCRSNGLDIYDLLESPQTLEKVKDAEFFAVLTCGWAAPISEVENDIMPSKSKQRRRVRLMVCADYTGVASVLRFSDKPNEIVTDDGAAAGSLADSVKNLYTQKVALELLGGINE